jgi:hypothetical protein
MFGAIAGGSAKVVIAPGDRIKILYQVNPERRFTLGAAWKSGSTVVRHTGVQGLWRGCGAQLLRVMPYSAITYLTYDRYERILRPPPPPPPPPRSADDAAVVLDGDADVALLHEHPVLARFFAGSLAGATATAATYPLDMLRARMAAHWSIAPLYPSYGAAVRDIAKSERLAGLFHGVKPTLIGIVPYAGSGFCVFHTFKARLRERSGYESDAGRYHRARSVLSMHYITLHYVPSVSSTLTLLVYSFHQAHSLFSSIPFIKHTHSSLLFRSSSTLTLLFYSFPFLPFADIPVVHRLLAGGIAGIIAQTVAVGGARVRLKK